MKWNDVCYGCNLRVIEMKREKEDEVIVRMKKEKNDKKLVILILQNPQPILRLFYSIKICSLFFFATIRAYPWSNANIYTCSVMYICIKMMYLMNVIYSKRLLSLTLVLRNWPEFVIIKLLAFKQYVLTFLPFITWGNKWVMRGKNDISKWCEWDLRLIT